MKLGAKISMVPLDMCILCVLVSHDKLNCIQSKKNVLDEMLRQALSRQADMH